MVREIRCLIQKPSDYLHYTFTSDSSHGRCTLQNSQTGSKSENRNRNHPSATRRSCGRIGENARRRDDYRYCQRECQGIIAYSSIKEGSLKRLPFIVREMPDKQAAVSYIFSQRYQKEQGVHSRIPAYKKCHIPAQNELLLKSRFLHTRREYCRH